MPGDNQVAAIALQTDGKILLIGSCPNGTNIDFCIARLNANGSLDSSFCGPSGLNGGQFLLPIGVSADFASAVALQPDGKIVIAGGCVGPLKNYFWMVRLNTNGALDTSFVGPAGSGGGKFLIPIGTATDNAVSAALQADGKIVLAGKCFLSPFFQFCVARLNGDGSLDSSFDGPRGTGNGKTLLTMGIANNLGTSVLVQPNGKIVVAGACSNGVNDDFCVTRLNGRPYAYKNCSMDIDGDGKTQATTDGLMITRLMLGMTGNAVVAGAVGAGASRTTWTQIRDYLVSQCGMNVAP